MESSVHDQLASLSAPPTVRLPIPCGRPYGSAGVNGRADHLPLNYGLF
jgi:hypothetical protein